MFGIGMPELVVILVVALVFLGPRRLPEMARTLGKGLAEFRKITGDVNKEIQGARDLIEREAREHERIVRKQDHAHKTSRTQDPDEAEAADSARPTEKDTPVSGEKKEEPRPTTARATDETPESNS